MVWDFEWGGQIEFLEGRKARGEKVPALDRRPKLKPGLDFYLNAYNELRYDRPIGMTMGPIPWSSVDRWAIRNGVDNDHFPVLLSHIRDMEAAVFDVEQKKLSKTKNANGQRVK